MKRRIRILGISGSLRKGSYNSATLKTAVALAPKDVIIETFAISQLPFFNADLEQKLPKVVVRFKKQIEKADAILFVSPEYNYSISGVLKNALEWGSRPSGKNSWHGKTAAILGASIGPRGTARAQLHLRQIFVDLNITGVVETEVLIGIASQKFDQDGKLIDNDTKERISKLLVALVNLTRKLSSVSTS